MIARVAAALGGVGAAILAAVVVAIGVSVCLRASAGDDSAPVLALIDALTTAQRSSQAAPVLAVGITAAAALVMAATCVGVVAYVVSKNYGGEDRDAS